MTSTNKASYERFVPQGEASLTEDAPGWNGGTTEQDEPTGPLCWKCRGSGVNVKRKRLVVEASQDDSCSTACTVCNGHGRLAPKRADVMGNLQPGVITRGRKSPANWSPSGPLPRALSIETKWSTLVKRANQGEHVVLDGDEQDDDAPSWIPRQGEQLCNLVGSWRILQRVGSHRWTTDDLCTAYVAAKQSLQGNTKYLDLGTGNGSVLQMVTWSLLGNNIPVTSIGIEARSEAVELARRSLAFNLGNDDTVAKVMHGDFRDVATTLNQKFDLITGTPPYFRVDFTVGEETVQSAVINQGGMPTAMQSAPARCEFRGGIEAYCQAACGLLKEDGRFVVCENWQNHDRVLEGAAQAGLTILHMLQVEGRQGRGTLFCVYTMKKKVNEEEKEGQSIEHLAVRNSQGQWTDQYVKTVLRKMSIPVPPTV